MFSNCGPINRHLKGGLTVEDILRFVAWIAFAFAALIGYSIDGWMGLLAGLVAVPIIALMGAFALVFLFGVLGAALHIGAWLCGYELED